MVSDHPLAAILLDAAHGRFPATDAIVSVLPALEGFPAALFGFTGHTIITTDLDREEVLAQLPSSDPGAPMNPGFIAWLGKRLGARSYVPDVVLAAFGTAPDGAGDLVERPDLLSHPRAVMAQVFRKQVRTYSAANGEGLVTCGLGVCGRAEVSVEVPPELRNRGLGRGLAYAARTLIPPGEAIFAQISPGNAASLRAFLAAGYRPIGTEVALLPAARTPY